MLLEISDALDAILATRWIHVIAGVTWLGMLWFFNWVNGVFTATLDAETKRKVVPELMPRALFWFRWGAAFTWLTGVMLLMFLYYSSKSGYLHADGTAPELMDWLPLFIWLLVAFVIYDLLFKFLPKNLHTVGVIIWGLIIVGQTWSFQENMELSGRAIFIHAGAVFGTAMAANVWMRIWPAQKRIITAIKAGEAPIPADPAMAGLRSKHNTYMSIPLLLFMVAPDQTVITGLDNLYMVVAGILVVGWVMTYALYKLSGTVKGF